MSTFRELSTEEIELVAGGDGGDGGDGGILPVLVGNTGGLINNIGTTVVGDSIRLVGDVLTALRNTLL